MDKFMKRVSAIQEELKAPKGQYNNFGEYRYRSCEDILEAVKPLLVKHNIVLTFNDDVVCVGDRYYIKTTACLRDTESNATLCNSAYAREAESKTKMDVSQLTGAASSYARKYALNGLFCIDDTKDADTDEYTKSQGTTQQAPSGQQGKKQQGKKPPSPRVRLSAKLKEKGIDIDAYAEEKGIFGQVLTDEQYEKLIEELDK